MTAISGTYAELNPLRYRGYVYDQELGLYYLGSRYYDLAVGRFVNGDAFYDSTLGIIAVQCGNEEIVALLIEAGADVNAQNQWGNAPLSMGDGATPMRIYSLLMQHGADPTIKNDYGVSMDEVYPFLTEMMTGE